MKASGDIFLGTCVPLVVLLLTLILKNINTVEAGHGEIINGQ